VRPELQFFPPAASTLANDVDLLFWFFVVVCGFFGLLVFGLLALFSARYRAKAQRYDPNHAQPLWLEIGWALPPLAVVAVLFVWGAKVYVEAYTPPSEALEIFVTGKQWMWKIQHPNGKKEINALHVPLGRAVKLTMTSEDVIHSFYVPAFRLKRDVLPGKYTSMWFEATQTGDYHLFCAEYCGTDHSRMIGRVTVMSQADYEAWLGGGEQLLSLEERGQRLFNQRACVTCHNGLPEASGPDLVGLFGSERRLSNGETVTADVDYLRESILYPTKKIAVGYAPVMPTFAGQLSEEQITALIEYMRTLKAPEAEGATP
jgi:cytochrome c oxidase subunit 2